jgi:hypothetical protein
MELEQHGGECCGVTHIFDFRNTSDAEVRRFKLDVEGFLKWQYDDNQIDGFEIEPDPDGWEDRPSKRKFSCVLEACLTDTQMMFWAPHLKEAGFKVVNRFLNSNSGNVVNVLHYNPAGRRKIPAAPYKW